MLRAIATSARLSNLPTVWTNVLVGAAAAGWAAGDDARPAWLPLIVALLTVSLLYTGGMFLNDVVDAEWDRAHKRDRPIARGAVSRGVIFAAAIVSLLAASAIAVLYANGNTPVLVYFGGLLLCVVLYDVLHKLSALSALLMGGCRGFTYLLAAAFVGAEQGGTHLDAFIAVYPVSIAIVVYIGILTLAARREDIAGAKLGGAWAWLMMVPVIGVPVSFFFDRPLTAILSPLPALVWLAWCALLARRGNIPGAVAGWIAGVCLFDATIFIFMHRPVLAGVAFACWMLTLLMQRHIAGT